MARSLILDKQKILEIQKLYEIKENGKRIYSHKKLGKMFFVDAKTICKYVKLKVRGDDVING